MKPITLKDYEKKNLRWIIEHQIAYMAGDEARLAELHAQADTDGLGDNDDDSDVLMLNRFSAAVYDFFEGYYPQLRQERGITDRASLPLDGRRLDS